MSLVGNIIKGVGKVAKKGFESAQKSGLLEGGDDSPLNGLFGSKKKKAEEQAKQSQQNAGAKPWYMMPITWVIGVIIVVGGGIALMFKGKSNSGRRRY